MEIHALFKDYPLMTHFIDEDRKIVFVNDCWLNTLGYSKDEALGRPSTDFLTENSKDFARRVGLPLFFELKKIRNLPYEMVKKNGDIIYVLLSAYLYSPKDGGPSHSIASSVDVSHIVKTKIDQSINPSNWLVTPENIPEKLVEIRKQFKFTQERMAEILGLSPRTYQRLENGAAQLTVEQVLRLTTELNLPASIFFNDPVNYTHKGISKVLLVEDEDAVAEMLRFALEDWGLIVQRASNGIEALKHLKKTEFEILITDLNMPDMSGIELLEELRKGTVADIPKIFVISASHLHEVRGSFNIPEENLFPKPINFERLRDSLFAPYVDSSK